MLKYIQNLTFLLSLKSFCKLILSFSTYKFSLTFKLLITIFPRRLSKINCRFFFSLWHFINSDMYITKAETSFHFPSKGNFKGRGLNFILYLDKKFDDKIKNIQFLSIGIYKFIINIAKGFGGVCFAISFLVNSKI